MTIKHGGLSSYSNVTRGMDTLDSLPHFGATEMLIGDQDTGLDSLGTMEVKSKSMKHVPPIKKFDAALLPYHADMS